MDHDWRHPGRLGAVLYAVGAAVVGGAATMVSRVQIAKHRGRRRVAASLPPGAVIVVSNHTSYADGLLLALVCRRLGRSLRLLATAGVFRAPIVGWLARRVGFIPVERGSRHAVLSLDAALQSLAAGEAIGIFPEGRITRRPDKWPEQARTGAVRLALRSGAPIVPVAMEGAHRVLDRDHMVSQIVSNVLLRPHVATAVGEPIDLSEWGVDPDDPTALRAATDRLMTVLVDLVEELRGESAPAGAGVTPGPG